MNLFELTPDEQREKFLEMLRKDLDRLHVRYDVPITPGALPWQSVVKFSFPSYDYQAMKVGYMEALENFGRWWKHNRNVTYWLSVEKNPWDVHQFDLVVCKSL